MTSTEIVKNFLELVQPLPVKYGYSRGIQEGEGFVSYRDMATQMIVGVGGNKIGERKTFAITVQTKTAEKNLEISRLIIEGTIKSNVIFISDDFRIDTTVEAGWINTIIVWVFTSTKIEPVWVTYDELMSRIAINNLIMRENVYGETLEESVIYVPEYEVRTYYITEANALIAEAEEGYLPRETLF